VTDEKEPLLVTIGDIGFSEHWVVTPHGTAPLVGTSIVVDDRTHSVSKTPTWAIVVAIVGVFFFFLSLLFLLVRETQISGYLLVTVRNGELEFTSTLPISTALQVQEYQGRAIYARKLAAAASASASAS
jgi:hypothetical protein